MLQQPPEVLCKKGGLKHFANFTGKNLCWSLFLIKFTKRKKLFIKNRLQHRCFSAIFGTFLRKPILENTCERLLLLILLFIRPLSFQTT